MTSISLLNPPDLLSKSYFKLTIIQGNPKKHKIQHDCIEVESKSNTSLTQIQPLLVVNDKYPTI
ncbi:hypothetical protein SDC9_22590 [bioreactor metagenome]|jgi:hypothetical protein|uniref:Uncharacterized protein n=1 Tax=bioreactor metagenome TaxID=1076179 RepID=A0A644UCM5_9ZZZZ